MESNLNYNSVPVAGEIVELDGIQELVRGNEARLLERLMPMVREHNVALDLRKVARIDAAGLAALITLYCDACKAGYRFTIVNPSHRVREILAIVGLDRLLVSPKYGSGPCFRTQLQEAAA